jgi:hypothetical protein
MMAKKKPYPAPKLTAIKQPDSLTSIARSLETIATSFSAWVHIESERFDKEYPAQPEVHEATVGTAEYPKPGEEGEEEEEEDAPWIGPREKRFNDQEAQRQARRVAKSRN